MSILFACYFEHWTECFDGYSIANQNKSLAHEYLRVFFLAYQGHCADGH